jgi:hypothetical protein
MAFGVMVGFMVLLSLTTIGYGPKIPLTIVARHKKTINSTKPQRPYFTYA